MKQIRVKYYGRYYPSDIHIFNVYKEIRITNRHTRKYYSSGITTKDIRCNDAKFTEDYNKLKCENVVYQNSI